VLRSRIGRQVAIGACVFMMAAVGCRYNRPRHGFVLRGDWSLEFNRVPWLASHGPEYQCPYPSCPPGMPIHQPMVEPHPAVPGGGQGDGRPVEGADAPQACSQGGAAAGPYVHPRFHAVPTRPAFSRPDGLGFPVEAAAAGDHAVDGEENSPGTPAVAPAPLPQPGPTAPQGADVEQPASAERPAATDQTSRWIFTGPPLGRPPRRPEGRSGRSDRVAWRN